MKVVFDERRYSALNAANAGNVIITQNVLAQLVELQNKINRSTSFGRHVYDYIDVALNEFNYLLEEYSEQE